MAFKPLKQSAPAASKPAPVKTAGRQPGVLYKTLRFLPVYAESQEVTNDAGETYIKWPWSYLGNFFKELVDGKFGQYTRIEMKTRVSEDDPEFTQHRYAIRVDKGTGAFTLTLTEGKRAKVFGDAPKGKDGRKFTQTADLVTLCTLQPVLKKDGTPREGWFEGKDAQGNTYQVIPYESKEERENRKARGGGGGGDALGDF